MNDITLAIYKNVYLLLVILLISPGNYEILHIMMGIALNQDIVTKWDVEQNTWLDDDWVL